MPTQDIFLSASHIVKRYAEHTALDDVSLTINEKTGEILRCEVK